ncbi:hypothetical protein Pelo_5806 [Pelomyxa schiedti]|nr:hypothetical protein Pelo_5806 [Pelomyxa schiedti]
MHHTSNDHNFKRELPATGTGTTTTTTAACDDMRTATMVVFSPLRLEYQRDGGVACRRPPALRRREPGEADVRVPAPRERALNSVAFMAEVAPGAPGGGACCCGGVMGGPRLCESERFSWVDARRNVVVEQPEEWERRACVVDTVTGQREDLGVVGVGEVLSNGRWAVIRSVQGRVWVAKVNAYCRHAAGHHHNRVPLIGDRVEINQEGISELPLREKFVSENVMCRLSEGPGEMLFCVLYDVGMSFATGKWVALDCVTFRDVRGVTTIQVSFCWERRALLGEKYDRQQNRLFTVDESGARLTLQTRPGSPILILDSYFVVLPSSEQHKKGMHTAEVWSFKDLSRQHCYFEVPTGSWVSACAGRCSDFLAILPPATGVPSGGTELHFIDVSCGMTLFTIHAHSGLSLLPPYSFGKVLWIAPTATTL